MSASDNIVPILSIILFFIAIGIVFHFRAGLIKILIFCAVVGASVVAYSSIDSFDGVKIAFVLFVLLGISYLIIGIIGSIIREMSNDEADYKRRRNSFIVFSLKWLVIYIIFGFVLEGFLSLFMDGDSAFLLKLMYGSRIFLVLLFIFFLIKMSKKAD